MVTDLSAAMTSIKTKFLTISIVIIPYFLQDEALQVSENYYKLLEALLKYHNENSLTLRSFPGLCYIYNKKRNSSSKCRFSPPNHHQFIFRPNKVTFLNRSLNIRPLNHPDGPPKKYVFRQVTKLSKLSITATCDSNQ